MIYTIDIKFVSNYIYSILEVLLMINAFTVSFFGHRQISDYCIFEELEALIKSLLNENEYVVFLVGRNGEFDKLVSSAIKKVQKNFLEYNCCHTLVLPYDTAEYRNNFSAFWDFYDSIEIFDPLGKTHFKSVITKRNKNMIDKSDLVIFYIENQIGGTFEAYKYACAQSKKIIIINS